MDGWMIDGLVSECMGVLMAGRSNKCILNGIIAGRNDLNWWFGGWMDG